MADAYQPPLSRATTGNTAFYSIVSNAPDVQPAEMTAPVTKTNRVPTEGEPSPEYVRAVNGTIAPSTDIKIAPSGERRLSKTAGGSVKKTPGSPKTATTEAVGTASGGDVVTPTLPSHKSREMQLSQHAVGTFANGAVTAVRCALASSPSLGAVIFNV